MFGDCDHVAQLLEPDIEAIGEEIKVSQRVLDRRIVLDQVLYRASDLRQRNRVHPAQRAEHMELDEVDERKRERTVARHSEARWLDHRGVRTGACRGRRSTDPSPTARTVAFGKLSQAATCAGL